MQLVRHFFAVLVFCLAAPVSAYAQCALSLSTNGTLALSPDGTVLGSEPNGTFGSVTISSPLVNSTITISEPTRTASPSGYDAGSETVQVRYFGIGGLNGINQAYTSAETFFSTGILGLASLLTLHNRIINPNGFAPGSYATRTVITCS